MATSQLGSYTFANNAGALCDEAGTNFLVTSDGTNVMRITVNTATQAGLTAVPSAPTAVILILYIPFQDGYLLGKRYTNIPILARSNFATIKNPDKALQRDYYYLVDNLNDNKFIMTVTTAVNSPPVVMRKYDITDNVKLSGEFVWLRLWGPWRGPLGRCAISLLPRAELPLWLELPLERATAADLGAAGRTLYDVLAQRGASFPTDLQSLSRLLPSHIEQGLGELVGLGLATCDSFAAMRQLAIAPSRRAFPLYAVGRWSLLPLPPADTRASEAAIELCAAALLRRLGVLSHAALLADRFPVPWRLLLRALRGMELRGEVRGGRFVTGLAGEQYALATAVAPLRGAAKAHALQAQ